MRERVGLRVEERARAPDDNGILPERALTDALPLVLQPVREPRGRRLLPQGVVDAPCRALRFAARFLVERGQHAPARLLDKVARLIGADAGRLPVVDSAIFLLITHTEIEKCAFQSCGDLNIRNHVKSSLVWMCFHHTPGVHFSRGG